jgi:hypothetical protein
MGIGSIFFKQVFDFFIFKRCMSKVEEVEKSFERLIPLTSLSSLHSFLSSLEPKGELVLSQFILKYYPDPCDYSPEIIPSFQPALFLSEKDKKVAELVYECAKKEITVPLKLTDLKKDLCTNVAGADAAITYIAFDRYITDNAFDEVVFFYPPNHRLKIVSPESVRVVKEGSFETRVLLKEGLNLITFILSAYGREVYRRNEFVLYTNLEPQPVLPPYASLKLSSDGNFLNFSFKEKVEALIVIGDKSFYIPETKKGRLYAFPFTSSDVALYTKERGGKEYLFAGKVEGAPLDARLSAGVEEGEASYKIKVDLSTSLGDLDSLTCSVFENGKLLIESGKCGSLALEFDKGINRLITVLLTYATGETKIPLAQCDIVEDEEGMFVAGCN